MKPFKILFMSFACMALASSVSATSSHTKDVAHELSTITAPSHDLTFITLSYDNLLVAELPLALLRLVSCIYFLNS